jgi:hypothetical protein
VQALFNAEAEVYDVLAPGDFRHYLPEATNQFMREKIIPFRTRKSQQPSTVIN